MPNWKKVIISGSNISQLTNDSGYVLADQVSGSSTLPISNLSASLTTTDQAISASIAALSGSASDARNLLESISASYALTASYSHTASYAADSQHSLTANEIVVNVKNTSGGSIAKGVPVYATGVTGDNINIAIASNLSSNTMPAIGVLGESLTANTSGTAVVSGKIIGVDTAGFTAGKNIYVNSNGDFTQTKPTGSSFIQNIGVVGKVNATEGEILIQGSGRSNDLPNLESGHVWVGDGDGVPTAVLTSSLSASYALTASYALNGGGSTNPTTGSMPLNISGAFVDSPITAMPGGSSTTSTTINGTAFLGESAGSTVFIDLRFAAGNSAGDTLLAAQAENDRLQALLNAGTVFTFTEAQNNESYTVTTFRGSLNTGAAPFGINMDVTPAIRTSYNGGTALTLTFDETTTTTASTTVTGDLTVSSNLLVTGSVNVSDSISGSMSGSFQGDGSGLTNIVSSSYALTASYALNGSGNSLTSSYALTASYAISSSHEITHEVSSSYAQTATSASYALTASYALNGGGSGFPSEYVTSNTTAEKGKTYVFETSTAYTLTLPLNPTNGDSIQISNRSNIAGNILGRNGELIMGSANDLTLDLATASFTLTYAGGNQGWVLIGTVAGSTTGSASSVWYDGGTFISSSADVRITGSLSMVGSEANFETLQIVLPEISQSGNFADDTAAAIGGIALGGLYRNGNLIAIRLS